jgi:hypothetical protein
MIHYCLIFSERGSLLGDFWNILVKFRNIFWSHFCCLVSGAPLRFSRRLGLTVSADVVARAALTPTRPGVDVMKKNFGDFRQFSAKKLALFAKTNVVIKFLQKRAVV